MKQVLVNSLLNSGRQVVAIVVAFVASPIIVHSLGDERYGLWSLVISITGYYSMLELGVTTAVVKYVSHFVAQKERERAQSVFSSASFFFAIVGLAILLGSIVVGILLPSWFEISFATPQSIFSIVVIIGISTALSILLSAVPASLFALQDIPALSIINMIATVTKNVLVVVLLLNGHGLVTMAVVTLLTESLRLLVLTLTLKLRHPFLRFRKSLVRGQVLRTILPYSAYSFLITIASKFLIFSSTVVVGRLIGVSEVTYFSIAVSLLMYVEAVIWSMQQVLIPVVSSYDATGDTAGNKRLYLLGTRYSTLLMLPVLVTLFTVGDVFIANWMGESYATKSGPVLQILCIGFAFHFSQLTAAAILKGVNRHRTLAFVLIVQALVGLLACIALATPYGLRGVAAGIAVPLVIANALFVPAFTCRVLGIGLAHYYRHSLLVPAVLTAVFLLGHERLAGWVSTYWDIALFALGTTVYFAVASWFFALEEEHRKRILLSLRKNGDA